MSEGETALDARAGEPPSPTVLRRVVLVVGWLAGVALVLLVLHLLGVDVEGALARVQDQRVVRVGAL